jgi:DNA-binding response OmpR family regulator
MSAAATFRCVRRQQERIVVAYPAEIAWGDRRIAGMSQDLSRRGVFVRTTEVLPIKEAVAITLDAGKGPVKLLAEVAHVLGPDEARSLGRFPGIGFTFAPSASVAPELFAAHIAEMLHAAQARSPVTNGDAMRVVVADGSTRLLERASTALGHAGFEVITASNGAEAFAACLSRIPDVLVAALHMPVMGGVQLVRTLGARPELAGIPVVMMSHDAGDLARLHAYQLGVADFIPKPFTVAELCIRVRRLARAQKPQADRVVLRGSLNEISLPALLSMFEFEQKTGILTVSQDSDIAWLSVSGGRIYKVRAAELEQDSRTLLMRVLDWRDGHFEFSSCAIDDSDEIGLSTTHMLLEHARFRDESAPRRLS